MVWHIFKKDWKLVWSFVLMVALLHWITALVLFKRGLFSEDATMSMLAETLPSLAVFASAFLIAAIVHLEAVPGVRQDWLIRPVSRRALLLEKFLFVIVTVEGPIFIANFAQGLASGFSLRDSFLDAAYYTTFLLFFLILPFFAFASVTRNMTEAFIFGCLCTFIIGAFLTVSGYLDAASHQTLISVTHSGIGWIGEIFRFAFVALAAGVILCLQYFRRKTTLARVLVVCFGMLLLISSYLPWQPVFAIEKRLSPRPGVAASISVAFEPARERYKPPSGLAASAENDHRTNGENDARVFLPLRINGMGSNATLLSDRVEVRVFDHERRVLYHGVGEDIDVVWEGSAPKDIPFYQQISIPMSIYQSIHDRGVGVRIDYSLTQFGLDQSFSMPALNGDVRTRKWGWCQTRMNEAGTAVALHCKKPGPGPTCATAFLQNSNSGAQNPSRSSCRSEYAPFLANPLPDDFSWFGTSLPFRDPTGLAQYPVDGSQLPQSRVVIRDYAPQEHFTRTLTIAQTRLRNWESQ
jgi:hypothetical protein